MDTWNLREVNDKNEEVIKEIENKILEGIQTKKNWKEIMDGEVDYVVVSNRAEYGHVQDNIGVKVINEENF